MKEKHKMKVTVSLIIFRNNKEEVLLQKRKNTGYMDGMYDAACSGHVEENESLKEALIREAKEEIGIDIKKEDIELISVLDSVNENYINFFFTTKKYEGIPSIMEKDKCEEINWFKLNEIPQNTISKVVLVLDMNNKLIIYDEKYN